MSKLRISTEKMTSLSYVWLNEKRGKIEAIPQLASLVPDIEAAHKDMSIVSASPPPANELLRAAIQKLYDLDDVHDQFFRAGYRMTQSQQSLAIALNRPTLSADLEQLEKRLYPHGLTGTSLKYEEEEGAALLVEQVLDDPLKARLKAISATLETGETFTLLHCVEEHIKTAKEIGSTERLKKKLQEQEAAPKDPNAVDGRKARFAWADVARAMESNAALALRRGTATPEMIKDILGGLQAAEIEADREYAQRKEKEAKDKEAKEKETATPIPGKD
jgi:hypothetical protein